MEKGKIKNIEVIHKTSIDYPKELPERWVIWANTNSYPYRGWIKTVEDDGRDEVLPLRLRSLLVKEFFLPVIGQEVEFSDYFDCYKECYSIDENALQEPYNISSFSEIHGWFQKNRPECLESDLKLLRGEKNRNIANKKREKEEHKKKQGFLKLSFVRGKNPRGNEQWETLYEGFFYVLRRGDEYKKGKVWVRRDRELVPGKVFLVARVY